MNKNLLLTMLLAAVTCTTAKAQENEFDFSSQRGERQLVNRVPGQKIDHQGIIINPTPQEMNVNTAATLNIASGFVVKDARKKFNDDLLFITRNNKGIKLSIDFGTKQASAGKIKPISGAYSLTVGKNGVAIVGYDEAGAFYGIQTLRQLMESPIAANGELPYITINDFPDMKYRGVVEGFYGTPWSHEVRMSLINFYGRHKMNNYIYGPKDDPYHSSPNWRKPYPADQAANIRELVTACHKNHVNFVWAIHPGKDIRWNKEDYNNLIGKFNVMYDLGVRAFAIFFDDIEGEGTNPNRQVELLNYLDETFVKSKGDVANLMVCPTDYSRLWANPGPNGALAIYGRGLNKTVEVFYTGDVVCSDLTKETMDFFNPLIQRPGLYWWNFPVSDYCRNYILQGPSYGLDTTLTDQDVVGIESNPMEHGEASKLALYGVADYAWNKKAYNPIDNWERGLVELAPYAADAYRTFAIHSADTETGYRRDESWETNTFRINNYTQTDFDALRAEFEQIVTVPERMELGCTNRGLITELRPWLVEFGKLGERGLRTLDLIKVYEAGDAENFWSSYIKNLMTDEEKAAFEAHKSGTMKLQPFYENAMNDMLIGFYKKLTGDEPAIYKGVGTFKNLKTNLDRLMLDNNLETYYTSATSQKAGDWIGLDLKKVRKVTDVDIHQGRNSVDDVDYFDHCTLEASVNGRDWTTLIADMEKVYDIKWEGEGIDARFIRLRRLDSKKQNHASIRTFCVNTLTPERLGFSINEPAGTAALAAFDNNPSTTFCSKGMFCFERNSSVKAYTLLLNIKAPVYVKQYNAAGALVATTPITSCMSKVMLKDTTSTICLEGDATIHELIPSF